MDEGRRDHGWWKPERKNIAAGKISDGVREKPAFPQRPCESSPQCRMGPTQLRWAVALARCVCLGPFAVAPGWRVGDRRGPLVRSRLWTAVTLLVSGCVITYIALQVNDTRHRFARIGGAVSITETVVTHVQPVQGMVLVLVFVARARRRLNRAFRTLAVLDRVLGLNPVTQAAKTQRTLIVHAVVFIVSSIIIWGVTFWSLGKNLGYKYLFFASLLINSGSMCIYQLHYFASVAKERAKYINIRLLRGFGATSQDQMEEVVFQHAAGIAESSSAQNSKTINDVNSSNFKINNMLSKSTVQVEQLSPISFINVERYVRGKVFKSPWVNTKYQRDREKPIYKSQFERSNSFEDSYRSTQNVSCNGQNLKIHERNSKTQQLRKTSVNDDKQFDTNILNSEEIFLQSSDEAMVFAVHKTRVSHGLLCDFCEAVNSLYGFPVLMEAAAVLICLVSWITVITTRVFQEQNVFIGEHCFLQGINYCMWTVHNWFRMTLLACACDAAAAEAARTGALAQKLQLLAPPPVHAELRLLSRQLLHRRARFTADAGAAGLPLDRSLLRSLAAAIAGYVVVVVQLGGCGGSPDAQR